LATVSSVHKHKKGKQSESVVDRVNEMVWEDYTYQQVVQELKVNPKIIKDYFISEGLIEKGL
jgi:hypothetical protein